MPGIHTVAVIRREESEVTGVGIAPSRVLHVVAVAVVGAVLARLAGEIHLQGALVRQDGVAHIHGGQGEGNLLFRQFEPKELRGM